MGKNVLIIGASGDIGIAIAEQLVKEDYQLLLHYHMNKDRIERFIKMNPDSVMSVIQADLSKENEIKMFLSQIVFPIDCIVFASGKSYFGLFQDTEESVMNEMMTLHILAPWLITKELLPSMIQKHYGKIIIITSIWGNIGASYEVIYSSVKGAQNSFVKALAKEVAPSGISVNAISPGLIATKMNEHLSAAEMEEVINDIPMNRAGLPSEVANAVSFLLDNKSSYIQGEILNINGGW